TVASTITATSSPRIVSISAISGSSLTASVPGIPADELGADEFKAGGMPRGHHSELRAVSDAGVPPLPGAGPWGGGAVEGPHGTAGGESGGFPGRLGGGQGVGGFSCQPT